MSFRQLNIKKVLVSGGSLDHRIDPQILNEGGGEKVTVLALDEAGRVSEVSRARLFIFLIQPFCNLITKQLLPRLLSAVNAS